jgi:hypothetical protein
MNGNPHQCPVCFQDQFEHQTSIHVTGDLQLPAALQRQQVTHGLSFTP